MINQQKFEPLISIITLTYNHENYIAECIESVLCQTYQNWEMIIVDDASTDKTPYIVEQYAKKDSRIKFIRNEKNNGPLFLDVNYNLALKEAKGDWIGYLEGDDVFTPKSLKIRVNALNKLPEEKRNNISLIHGRYGRIWMNSKTVELPIPYYEDFKYSNIVNNTPSGMALIWLLSGFNFIFPGTVLVSKEKLLKIGGFKQIPREIRSVDYCTWTFLALEGEWLYIPKFLHFWRRHSNSITMQYSEEIVQYSIQISEYFWKNFHEKILDKLNGKFTEFERCLGVLVKIELARFAILNRDFKTSGQLLKEIANCPYIEDIFPDIFKKKLKVVKLAYSLRMPIVLKMAILFKRTIMNKKYSEYKPFFFKDLKDID
ncbi:glycosyl transferase family 2 [Sulfurihydrogenibium sp. YO3AOP1]|uniref:glycosyltransferase family 2 protein n=1 Tax=Sulfurihydrogenibium sp. (strain YO3AOP1) TaxID=436114 RepID=UPI0001724071|nr:glycosyltransferase family 2 protein [Sulfurihydrogenibium sp. YO3AOP1]ACD67008.1 glycosyl transferase family 2 [Sulfurihydrogenibium sp. YO3AOP1]